MSSGLDLSVEAPDLNGLYKALKGLEGNLRVELRRGIVAVAQPVADQIRSNASWSSRIPGAVKVKASFAAKSAGVSVFVDSSLAPEARPLENGGSTGTFRHPVFADQSRQSRADYVWVSQAARPFFGAAAAQVDSKITDGILAIVKAVEKDAGFS